MTIHKAKGLEFPVVIIPFLEIDVVVGTGGGGTRKPYVVKEEDGGSIRLTQLKKEYTAYSGELDSAYRSEYARSLIDELDSLYVALTRARYELYAFIPPKSSNIFWKTGITLTSSRTITPTATTRMVVG